MSSSFERFLVDLKEAIAWATSIGVNVDGRRFEAYTKVVERGLGGDAEPGRTIAEASWHAALTAIEAGQELVLIHQHLSDQPTKTLRGRLEKYVQGTVLEKDERPQSGSNRARNIGFELVLGARLASAGAAVSFPAVGDLDVAKPAAAALECKRPQSEKKMGRAISDASRQLASRLRDPAAGVIAIATGKMTHGGTKLLRAPSIDAARTMLDATAAEYVRHYDHMWQQSDSAAVHAVLVEVSAIIHVAPDGWYWGSCSVVNPVERNRSQTTNRQIANLVEALKRLPTHQRY